MNGPKQIILVRKDIKLPKGKLGSQTAHASLGVVKKLILAGNLDPFYYDKILPHPEDIYGWKRDYIGQWWLGSWTKVCLGLGSIDELDPLLDKCVEANLIYDIVTDNGLTVYNGTPTITCIGIEPSSSEILDPIFGHLKLY